MAKDVFHDVVRAALQKDGWSITHDPYELRVGGVEIVKTHRTFFSLRFIQTVVKRSKISLLIYAPEQEVIVQWQL